MFVQRQPESMLTILLKIAFKKMNSKREQYWKHLQHTGNIESIRKAIFCNINYSFNRGGRRIGEKGRRGENFVEGAISLKN